MGGKNSGGEASNSVDIPDWIKGIIQPMLQGSASKLATLQNQGFDVLQGNTPQTGISLEELQSQGGNPNTAGRAAGQPGNAELSPRPYNIP